MDMRKLILTSIKGKTGDLIWEEDRLVVVNHNQGDVEEDLLKKAAAHAKNWLKTERPNSEYLAIVPKATIGQDPEPEADFLITEESDPSTPKAFFQIFHVDGERSITPLTAEDWDKGDRYFNTTSEATSFIKDHFKDCNKNPAYNLVILPVYSVESKVED